VPHGLLRRVLRRRSGRTASREAGVSSVARFFRIAARPGRLVTTRFSVKLAPAYLNLATRRALGERVLLGDRVVLGEAGGAARRHAATRTNRAAFLESRIPALAVDWHAFPTSVACVAPEVGSLAVRIRDATPG